MNKHILACLIALSAPLVISAQTPKRGPTKDEVKIDMTAYKNAIKEGRDLHKKKDYTGAIKAFQKALVVIPNDPRALSELGFSAYTAKDYDLAEKSTRAAIAGTLKADLKGSALYNLGLILVAKGDNTGASKAYVESLQLRPNNVVLKALTTIDPKAAESYNTFTAHELAGPTPKLDNLCTAHEISFYEAKECVGAETSTLLGGSTSTTGKGAITKAQWVSAGGSDNLPIGDSWLAIQTKDGWFQDYAISNTITSNKQYGGGWWAEAEVSKMEIKDVIPGGEAELLIYLTTSNGNGGSIEAITGEHYESTSSSLIICGVGASKRPSCTTPILLKINEDNTTPKKTILTTWEFSESFTATGELEIAKKGGKPTSAALTLVGKHTLVFP